MDEIIEGGHDELKTVVAVLYYNNLETFEMDSSVEGQRRSYERSRCRCLLVGDV